MARKRYTSRKKVKSEGGNEVLGIGLIIASAFILLCIIVPPLIGVVSHVVYGVITGVFGFVAYPLFLGLLFLGIALTKGWKVAVSKKQIAAIGVIAFSFVMILQLAITHSYLDLSFGEYVSRVYRLGGGACGALFGILAFGMKAGLTTVFTYILLSAAIAAMTLLLFGVGTKRNVFKAKKRPPETEDPRYEFVKGTAMPHPVQPIADTSLFVESIVPTATKTESGSFGTLPASSQPTQSGYSTETSFATASKTATLTAYAPQAQTDSRAEARRILFEENRSNYPVFDPDSIVTKTEPSTPKQSVMPETLTSQPAVRPVEKATFTKPPKVVHGETEEHKPSLPEVVFPEAKDFSDQIVGGTIINGDDLSEQIMEQRGLRTPSSTPERDPFARPQRDDFSVHKIDAVPLAPIDAQSVATEPEIPPIMNGDLYTEALLRKQSESVLSSASPKVQSAQPTPQPQPIVSRVSDEDRTVAPQAETEPEPESASLTSFEKMLMEERARRDAAVVAPPVEETSALPVLDDIVSYPLEETATEAQSPIVNGETGSAFTIENEVVDLSETAQPSAEDFTGYYEPVVPAVPERAFKRNNRIADNQIGIDEYEASEPMPEPPKPIKKKRKIKYVAPPIELLMPNSTAPEEYGGDSQEKAQILEQTLESLKLPAKVVQITKGPAVTRYELEMQPGIPIKRIESFQSDIAYNLASNGKIRIETPIPGKRAVGVEVPNEKIASVALREIIESKQFQSASSPLSLALGKDIAGQNIVCQLEKMPHLLVAGATGSGKSVCLNSIIVSILYKASPEDVRLILIDPKEVEFAVYSDMPHLLMKDIISDTAHAINAFKWAKAEMDRRYKLLKNYLVHNIAEFNNSQAVKDGVEEKLPHIVIIVDELCELMMSPARKELEEKIMSMAQKARAAGLHLILATQRPSVDVITGTIKANLPSRIAFAVTSYTDSRTILDQGGAESLLGRGDMLYAPSDIPEPKRVQGAYVTTEEVSTIVGYVKEHNESDFDDAIEEEIMVTKEVAPESKSGDDDEDDNGCDVLMKQILKRVITSGAASTSMIQRRFSVGYARASRIIDQMENMHFIGPLEGSKPREVYITREKFKELFDEDVDDIS